MNIIKTFTERRFDGGVFQHVDFEIAQTVAEATKDQIKKEVRRAVVEELEKNEEFKRTVRELTIENIMSIIEERKQL